MKRLIWVFVTIIGFFIIFGCYGEKKEYSRYPSISVAGYLKEDYCKLLSDKNPEVVYNAICNLLPEADSIGRLLSDDKADKNSKEHIFVSNTFTKIIELLKSKDDRILSSNLRFLQLFSDGYSKKKDLIVPVLKIKSKSANVQYEQVMLLSEITSKDSKIDPLVLKRFLNNKSWLVSRATYFLINALQDETIRLELVKRYKSIDNEMEKLLILNAFEDKFSDDVFKLLRDELISTKSDKIKNEIFGMLGNGQDEKKVIEWLDKNYENFPKKDIDTLVNMYDRDLSDKFSNSLFIIFAKKDFVPKDDFLKKLISSIKTSEAEKEPSAQQKEELKDLLSLKEALLANAPIKEKWQAVEAKLNEEGMLYEKMDDEYGRAVDQFAFKIDEILKKYKIAEDKRKEFLKNNIYSLKESFLYNLLGESF